LDKISEVWIIKDSGLLLFNQSVESSVDIEIDEMLFSGFLSSIQSFIKEIGEKKLERLELGTSKLTFYNLDEYGVFVVLRSPKKTKNKFLEKKIKHVQEKFIEKYGNHIINMTKNNLPVKTEDFIGFKNDLETIFEPDIAKNIDKWFEGL